MIWNRRSEIKAWGKRKKNLVCSEEESTQKIEQKKKNKEKERERKWRKLGGQRHSGGALSMHAASREILFCDDISNSIEV